MITRRHTRRTAGDRDQRGVTVIELVVAMSLFALVASSIYSLVNVGGRSITTTNDLMQSQAQVRAAIDNVVDEMRWAQSLTAAGPTSVTVLVPQATPFSPTSPYTVTFAYDGATDTLTRQVDPDAGGPQPAGAPEPLAFGVVRLDGTDGLAFEYYDGMGTSLGTTPADLASVVRVRITVTTSRDRTSRTMASDVALRGR